MIINFKLFKESNIEYDFANKKLANKMTYRDKDETKYENQGWFLYKIHKSIINPHAKNPPKNGFYDVKSVHGGMEIQTDVAEFKNGKFKDSRDVGLKDNEITYWKIRQSDDEEFKYKYDFETGKYIKVNKRKKDFKDYN